MRMWMGGEGSGEGSVSPRDANVSCCAFRFEADGNVMSSFLQKQPVISNHSGSEVWRQMSGGGGGLSDEPLLLRSISLRCQKREQEEEWDWLMRG